MNLKNILSHHIMIYYNNKNPKEDHERKHENHLQRELNYHLRHLREIYIEKVEISTESYESPVAKEFGDNDLKKMKEILLNEMGLLKEDKEKG